MSLQDEHIAVEVSDTAGNLAFVLYTSGKEPRVVQAGPGDIEMERYLSLFRKPPQLVSTIKEIS